jgi:hypothetical protein
MIEQNILLLIEKELSEHKQEKNQILKNFPNSIIEKPFLQTFHNDWSKAEEEYWVVFDEFPNDLKNGYLIIHNESINEFGLATKTSLISDKGTLIGIYGSFIDSFIGM